MSTPELEIQLLPDALTEALPTPISRPKQLTFADHDEKIDLKIYLTEGDFARGEILAKKELIDPITPQSLFEGALYAVLSAAESYQKLDRTFATLLEQGLNTPQSLLERSSTANDVLKTTRFPTVAPGRVQKFAKWWKESSIPMQILNDSTNGREKEFELRNALTKSPGIREKVASYLFERLGYLNIVTIDIWMLRYLQSRGLQVRVPDYRGIGMPGKAKYLEYERLMQQIAREEYGMKPATFRRALWAKMSGWREGLSTAPTLMTPAEQFIAEQLNLEI